MSIRSALGAGAPHLRRLVLGHAARLTLIGTVVGLACYVLAYGLSAIDLVSVVAVTAVVLAATLAASLAPSLRAGRSAPMDLLREL
jgi:ABC-type lipoprotein release transport system permease subunit